MAANTKHRVLPTRNIPATKSNNLTIWTTWATCTTCNIIQNWWCARQFISHTCGTCWKSASRQFSDVREPNRLFQQLKTKGMKLTSKGSTCLSNQFNQLHKHVVLEPTQTDLERKCFQWYWQRCFWRNRARSNAEHYRRGFQRIHVNGLQQIPPPHFQLLANQTSWAQQPLVCNKHSIEEIRQHQ